MTTPAVRTMFKDFSRSPTRRGSVERRRPGGGLATSSSAAARRRYFVDNLPITSAATATLFRTFYALSSSSFLSYSVAAILFSSAHVFLRLPVIRLLVC